LASRLETEINELEELAKTFGSDPEINQEIKLRIEKLEEDLLLLEKKTLFSDIYDSREAILTIRAGTGGVDAQDFAQILLRMYLRFCERRGFKAKIISQNEGHEAGIKSASVEIKGPYAYGNLKSETGIHRLVRLSPFNANNLRQTSFVEVEVLPKVENVKEVQIEPGELEIDTFRSGGAGGQHVNKTESAVRVKHIPTGITAVCQSERSQLQNKEKALEILKSRLLVREISQREENIKKLKGKHAQVQWGSQIRSYVIHPYKLVKDIRTGYESKNPEEVFNGKIDGFIEAYLKKRSEGVIGKPNIVK